MVCGKWKSVPLDVKVKGSLPTTRRGKGDETFEKSKWEAENRIEELEKEVSNLASEPEMMKAIGRFRSKMNRSKKGEDVSIDSDYLLADHLAIEWAALPRKRKGKIGSTESKRDSKGTYTAQVQEDIKKFVKFCRGRNMKLVYAYEITNSDAEAFIMLARKGLNGKTCNNKIVALRSVFNRLKKRIGSQDNPFDGVERFDNETISRKSYTNDQIEHLYEFSLKNRNYGELVIVGLFTGMREGDCCLLRWEKISFMDDQICAKADKTGEDIWIPLFPALKKMLLTLKPKKTGYVFPLHAKAYSDSATNISAALIGFISKAFKDDKTFKRTVKRKHGLRRASVYDFAALRTTWITLAVMSGIPLAVICLVSGHTSEKMIMENYLKPDTKALRDSFGKKMVGLSQLGQPKPTPGIEVTASSALDDDLLKLLELLDSTWMQEITGKRDWAKDLIKRTIAELQKHEKAS